MYTYALDPPRSCLVGIHSGASSDDADFRRVLEAMEQLQREAGPLLGAIMLVVDDGDHIPPSPWRKRFAELRRVGRSHRFAFITESRVARGVVTAIDWLQPPRADQQVRAWATLDEGIAWIEKERGEPMPVLRELYATARAAGLPPRRASARRASPA